MKLKKTSTLKAGGKYFLRLPNYYDGKLVHVDYILDNPLDEDGQRRYKIIVYRVWHKYKKYWQHHRVEYFSRFHRILKNLIFLIFLQLLVDHCT